jgi:acetolactate synthase-1/2/3 large subunit
MIAGARRPLVLAGGGAVQAGAGAAVAELAERLVAPVITTYAGRGLLAAEHPCDVGLPPHVPQVGALWDEADCVVAVGTDLDGMTTQNWAMPAPPQLVAINVDPADASKAYLPDALVEADAAAGAAAVAERVDPRTGAGQLERRLGELRATVRAEIGAEEPRAIALLDAFAALPPEATLVCDMCIPGYWLGGFHRPPAPRRLLYPIGWGTLGCAFPQALGAALAAPGPVVSVSGDGGFLFACGELATARQEDIPLTAVIVDDGGYGMLRFDQEQAGEPHAGVDLETPDFVALARSFGVPGEVVDGVGEAFAAKLAEHAAIPHPTVLVANAALSPPPTVSPRWYRRR